MLLFAEMSDAVILAIIGLATVFVNAVTVVATMIVKELLDQRRAVVIKDATVVAAEKVETKLIEVTAAQNEKLDDMAAKVEVVHKATNSLTDKLIASTEAEALARGGVEERARAEGREKDEVK